MSVHAINARTTGISEYTGLTLSALAVHEGRLFGLSGSALVEFTGAQDEGVDFTPHVKTGMQDFKSDEYKAVDRIYPSFEGSSGLSVTTTTVEDDADEDHVYSVRALATLADARAKLDKGAKSRWWAFKIAGVPGGTFRLKRLTVRAFKLARRKWG